MPIVFPTNTAVLIIALMIATGAGTWFILARGLQHVSGTSSAKRTWRWGTAILLITWLLGRLVLSIDPPGAGVLGTPYSFVSFTFLIAGLLVGIMPLLISPIFRQIIRAAPMTWLVGLHTIRIGGFAWLALADMQLLPNGFALPAGYGDMTVGLLALALVYVLGKRKSNARTLIIGWNVLGVVDFVVAVTTAFMYMSSFTAELVASGIPLGYLNYPFLIPSYGVPLFALLHIYSLFQILSPRSKVAEQRIRGSVQTPLYP
jgi:hypothetical protein